MFTLASLRKEEIRSAVLDSVARTMQLRQQRRRPPDWRSASGSAGFLCQGHPGMQTTKRDADPWFHLRQVNPLQPQPMLSLPSAPKHVTCSADLNGVARMVRCRQQRGDGRLTDAQPVAALAFFATDIFRCKDRPRRFPARVLLRWPPLSARDPVQIAVKARGSDPHPMDLVTSPGLWADAAASAPDTSDAPDRNLPPPRLRQGLLRS